MTHGNCVAESNWEERESNGSRGIVKGWRDRPWAVMCLVGEAVNTRWKSALD